MSPRRLAPLEQAARAGRLWVRFVHTLPDLLPICLYQELCVQALSRHPHCHGVPLQMQA